MRNYWIRIAFGALAIFVVGMIGLTLARRGIGRVDGVVHGSGPITLPIAFVPFKLDGEKLGTINRIKVYRSAPDKVKSVDVTVRLADSVSPARLEGCILVAEGFENFNSQTTIKCASSADTAGEDLADIGQIALSGGDRSFRLLMPRDAIRQLTESDSLSTAEDSAAASQERADSIVEAAAEKAASTGQALGEKGDSIGRAASRRADSIIAAHKADIDKARADRRRLADSVRSR